MASIELDIWRGEWGLASIDLECLKVLTYMKFIGVPVRVREANNPFFTPKGRLPVMRDGRKLLTNFEEVVEHLKSLHYSTDVHLNTKQAAEASAFTQYLREKLYPAYQYAWWVDEKNYSDLTRPTYAKALCIPFNFYYPSRYQNAAKEMIDALYGEHTDLREIEKTERVSVDKMETEKVYSNFMGTKKDGTVIKLRIVKIQEKHKKDFLDLYINHFVKEESTFRAAGVSKSARALQEFRQAVSNRMTNDAFKMVVCCLDNDDETTDTIIGGSIMELTTAENYHSNTMIPKSDEQKKLFQVYGDMVNSYEVMKAFKMEKYFVDRGVVVHPDYRGLGIAQELFKVRRMQCKEHGIPIHGAWMTSYGTQKAGERDGWITVYEIDYQELGPKHGVTFKKGPPSCKYMIARIDLD